MKPVVPPRPPLSKAPLPRLPFWGRLSVWRASSRTVLVSLLVGMLLVVGVTVGSMLFFSNLVVQRQIARLPPDLRDQFRDHNDSGGPSTQSSSTQNFSTQSSSTQSPGSASTGNADHGDPHGSGAVSGAQSQQGQDSRQSQDSQQGQAASVPKTAAFQPPTLIGPVMPLSVLKLISYPLRRANGFLRDVGESLRAASLVSAVFGLLLALILARRIARPISEVSEAAARVAAGDLSVRAKLLPGDRETTELARSFNAMAHGLELLEQERRDTVASIAHELRTPLTVMQARLDAIEDGIYPLDQEQVGQLSAQTQLLTRLVADLRTLSLAQAGRLTLQPSQVAALRLARSVAQDIQAARAGSIQVEVVGQEATLSADPDRLRQVLVNLTENAFKHARSRVRLTVQQGEQNLSVHVDDDGPGIPEPEREHVFERFVRLETSRSRDSGGTGLGLAVVHALMQAHGGDVTLGASPLGGTRATVRFPVEVGG